MIYAHYNDAYKKALVLSRALGARDEKSIFELAGLTPSSSQLQGWRVGREHKNFRPMQERELLAFFDGLITWVDDNNGK